MAGFLFGGDTKETPDSIKRKRDLVRAIMGASNAPRNIGEGLNALGDGIVANVLDRRANAAETEGRNAASSIFSSIIGGGSSPQSTAGAMGGAMPSVTPSGGVSSPPVDMTENEVFSGFMDTVKSGGVTNPNALAAIAATGQRESRFDPANVNRTWSDPSESGEAGTSGGIMSWRGPRYQALAATGDLSPQGQAKFFLQEDPQLIARLNTAKTPEEAQQMMNEAWKFAGWNRPGGEAAARFSAANAFLPKFMEQGDTGAEAIEAVAPQSGGSLTDEVIAFQHTPEYAARFPGDTQTGQPLPDGAFNERFGETVPTAQIAQGRGGVSAALQQPNQMPVQQPQQGLLPPEFAGSQQLQSAMQRPQGSIIQALMADGQQASPQQLAQARAAGSRQPQQGAQQGGALGVDPRLLQALSNPFLNDSERAVIQGIVDQQMQANDPMRQMQLEEGRLKLNAMKNPQPEYDFISGKDGSVFRADKRAGQLEQVYGGKAETYRPLSAEEAASYGLPPGGNYQIGPDNKVSKIGGEGTTVNIDQRAEGAFDKKLAEGQAEAFNTMATEGLNARGDLAVIDELSGLLEGQGGTLTGIASVAAKYGLGGDNMSDLQAAEALLNKLTPSQRQPGSGSMSDRDVEMFKRSLPSLWNAPGGNARILTVMRGLTEYKQAQGEIADQVLAGEMTRQEARRALRELPNPLSGFGQQPTKGGRTPVKVGDYTIEEVD